MNVQEIIKVTRQLPPEEKRQLLLALEADVRAEKSEPPTAGNEKAEIRERRMKWLKANQARYGGQYVVMDEDRLLGTARSYREGRELARSQGVANAFVDYLSKSDEEGEMGGW